MSQQRFSELIIKYKLDSYSSTEKDELLAMLVTGEYHNYLAQTIALDFESGSEVNGLHPAKAEQILQRILDADKVAEIPIRKLSYHTRFFRLAVAAAITGIIFSSAYFIISGNNSLDKEAKTALKVKSANTKNNGTKLPQKIQLEDGSTVVLQPGASLYYASHFLAEKREVYLDGEAFFDITKNSQRPFFVYHNNLVTQVLGTSFTVRIDKATNNVEVEVRTGRVQVYERIDSVKGSNRQSNGVILTPNQKVLYVEQNSLFVPMLVDVPLPIKSGQPHQPPVPNFRYDRTALGIILPALAKTYGVEIIPENTAINNCLFTGDLSDPDLFAKLDVLCTVIKSTYEVKGNQILLKGVGCN